MSNEPVEPRHPLAASDRLRLAWDTNSARWLVAVLVAVVALVGLWVWRSSPGEQANSAQLLRPASPIPSDSAASASTGPVLAGTSVSAAPSTIVVDVTGPVRRPGIVTLPSGSRVADALAAAGGLVRGKLRINLARVLRDGEQVDASAREAAPLAAGAIGPRGAAPPGSVAGDKVDLNTATLDQLDQLPRVGPITAQKIIDFRTQNGGYRSVDQLQEVSGIGERTFAQLAPLVRV